MPSSANISRRPPPTTIETARVMRDIARKAKGDWGVRQLASKIVRHVAEKDYRSEALALYHWVCKNSRYTRDPHRIELVRDPDAMLRELKAHGVMLNDCDDQSVLIGSLAMSIGLPVRFVTIGFTLGGSHSHVFPEVQVPGGWLMLDPVAGPRMRAMAAKVQTAHRFPL